MKYYIIAGEMSGDLHASFLMKELKIKDKDAEFRFWGGDKMIEQANNQKPVKHIKELAFMGFVEVVANLRTVLRNLSLCKKDIVSWNPDAVILVDYPGFNLRIAKFVHKLGIKVYYYISPQVWAWKKGRIKTMKKVLDKLFVILPFEKPFYDKHSMEVEYPGNPLLDEISHYSATQNKEEFLKEHNLGAKPIIALLPGSRTQEIKKMLPLQLSLVEKFPEFDFVVAGVSTHSPEFYNQYMEDSNAKLIYNNTYSILNSSHAAIVTSGTATLETALFNVPEVVCYKANPLSFILGKYLVKIRFISLVNLILDSPVVVELLQDLCNRDDLEKEFRKITFDENNRVEMRYMFGKLRNILGNAGASANIAKYIVEDLRK
ncbi:MAG: lipid-A-disaccharide synthase [Bacteroidales bacterium]|nr:lipid-A-disaccharide synthase [Bacteroidales bacterium]